MSSDPGSADAAQPPPNACEDGSAAERPLPSAREATGAAAGAAVGAATRTAAQRAHSSTVLRIGLCTLASRFTGLARDILLTQTFGLSWVADAFQYAFQIPNLFRRLLGEGAMAAAFVPTFTQTLEKEGRPAAWALLARTLALLTATLASITLLIELILLGFWLAAPLAGPEKAAARVLLVQLTALMLPFMLSVCVLSLFSSILNCVGSFVPAALAPIVLNLGMIVGIVWFGPWCGPRPEQQVYGVALSVLGAGIAQVLMILPALRAHGVPLNWQWQPSDPHVMRALKLMGPVLLGQGVLAVGVFLDGQVCTLLTHVHDLPAEAHWFGLAFRYPLEEGALSAINAAARLYQFPLGVLALSLATAALPQFSRFATRGEWGPWATSVVSTLRMALYDGFIAGAAILALTGPLVRLLYERGKFTPEDTTRAAFVLGWYGLGMWAYCSQHIVLRAFYSVGDVRTPLRLSAALLPVNLALSLMLIWLPQRLGLPRLGEAAFAISSVITSGAAVLIGMRLLEQRTRVALLGGGLLGAVLRMLLAAGAAGLAMYLAHRGAAGLVLHVRMARILSRAIPVSVALTAGAVVYLGLSMLLKLHEPQELLGRLVRRRKR